MHTKIGRKVIGALLSAPLFFALIAAPTGASAVVVTIDSTIHGHVDDVGPLFVPPDGTPDTFVNNELFIANSTGWSGWWQAVVRPIIEFDISSLTAPVTLAELSLTGLGCCISAPLSGPNQIDVYSYTGDGALTLADWNEVGSLVTSFIYTQAGDTIVTLDVTSFINAHIAANDNWAGFLLDLPVGTGNEYAVFGNSDATYPVLNVESAVPLPAALPLFGTALAGMGLLGWRRKRKAAAAV